MAKHSSPTNSFEKPRIMPKEKDKTTILNELAEDKAGYLIEKNNAEILDYLDKHLNHIRKDYNQKLENLAKDLKLVKRISLLLIVGSLILGVIING